MTEQNKGNKEFFYWVLYLVMDCQFDVNLARVLLEQILWYLCQVLLNSGKMNVSTISKMVPIASSVDKYGISLSLKTKLKDTTIRLQAGTCR